VGGCSLQRATKRDPAPRSGAQCFIQAKAHRHRPLSKDEWARNRTKSKVRAKVEHAFSVIKRIGEWATVRYCGLANLYVARRHLLAAA
jgi:IS5 family transposase